MAETQYYPLSPMKDPLDVTSSPLPEQALKTDSNMAHLVDTLETTDPPGSHAHSSVIIAPLRPKPFSKRQVAGKGALWRTIRPPLGMALFPLAAIAYLAFCYTVHGKVVPVNTYGLYTATPQHLASIKGGITTITIIVISIAFYPVYDIIATLKSEEFFRVLASHAHGVPLESINHISTPSFGKIDMMMAMWKNGCSNYYILGVVASLLIWIVGTLAPGALTIDSVLSDGGVMAFSIGAVPVQSVLNGTNLFPISSASVYSPRAASIAWAELELNVQYSFSVANTTESDYAAFITPVPLNLSTTTSARWLSDVVGINPACAWPSTNITTPLQVPFNASSDPLSLATVNLPDFDLDVQLVSADFASLDTISFAEVKDPNYYVTNHTTHAIPSDGSTVFLLGQCSSGCSSSSSDYMLDLSGLNTTFMVALTNQTWTVAILTCKPNATIETREVRSEGGIMSVQPIPSGRSLTLQGNLNPVQTTAMFSVATLSLAGTFEVSGSGTGSGGGSQLQNEMLFGKAQFDGARGSMMPITPAPIAEITQVYIQLLQSLVKPFLAGSLGAAYVPGRISQTELVFVASIPNLAVATVGFVLIAGLVVLLHFRPNKGFQFSLANVAAAMHGSELPSRFAQLTTEKPAGAYGGMNEETNGALGMGKLRQGWVDSQDITDMLAERRIFMQRRADGSPVLHVD